MCFMGNMSAVDVACSRGAGLQGVHVCSGSFQGGPVAAPVAGSECFRPSLSVSALTGVPSWAGHGSIELRCLSFPCVAAP